MAEKWHSGISMHKLTVGEGFGGLVFTVGSVLIFVIGIPALWYFVAFGAAFGIAVAVFLRLSTDSRSRRAKPLSIFSVPKEVLPERERQNPAREQSMRPVSASFAHSS